MHATIEAAALELYDLARADPAAPPSPVSLARAVLGRDDAVQIVPDLRVRACLLANEGVILIRAGATRAGVSYLVGHELAHLVTPDDTPDLERRCDAIGAALVLPEPAVRLALARGRDGAELARRYRTTQSIAWLRIGEVTQTPTALVMRDRVRVTAQGWPRDLRAQAWGARPTGLYRQRITDARGRVVVTAR